MPRQRKTKKPNSVRVPSYRLHKASGQAITTIAGRDIYLGAFNSERSRAEYERLIGEFLVSGRTAPRRRAERAESLTVAELVVAYTKHIERTYPSKTVEGTIKPAIRRFRKRYGHTLVEDFGPLALKALRQSFIDEELSRTYINRLVKWCKSCIRWGVSEELVPASVLHGLESVSGLRRGRSEAKETAPIRPVPDAWVNAVRPLVSRQVRALIDLQLLTGARPGELLAMRAVDLEMSGKVWTYAPRSHKTELHGHHRTIYIGPKAQQIIEPFLTGRAVDARLFSPKEAEAERRASMTADRKTPLSCGNRPGTNKKRRPKKEPGDQYTVDSYRRSIHYACDKAKIDRWSPHRLRHNAATQLRRDFGIDIAQTILGHQLGSGITEIYAEANIAKAQEIVASIG